MNWSHLEWCRAKWKGKLAIKGILTVDDAQRATHHGVDAIIVSNHGGRQLDGAPSALAVLPDGSRASAVYIITVKGPREYTWESINREIDGDIQPDLGPFTLVRAQNQPSAAFSERPNE